MVANSDAVADPRAVMVHPHDAAVANGAVVRPGRLNVIAAVAILVL